MDRLFKRYADPFLFIDGMIQTGRFDEFVENFIQTTNNDIEFENHEKEMRLHWDCWLHKIFDKDFKEYMDELENQKNHQNMSERTLETTVQHSMDILNTFNPEKGGE